MKIRLAIKLTALVSATLTTLLTLSPLKAATFDEQEVDQSLFVALARPYGNNQYDLLVIEQIPKKQPCWAENGANPTRVEPLLLKFDFTGICRRSTDSNGYSMRLDGEDQGLNYILRVVPRNGELVLIGSNRNNPTDNEVIIGRTHGLSDGFLKIILEPGWKITKRAYQGKALGHVYFSAKQSGGESNTPTPVKPPELPLPQTTPTPTETLPQSSTPGQ